MKAAAAKKFEGLQGQQVANEAQTKIAKIIRGRQAQKQTSDKYVKDNGGARITKLYNKTVADR